MTQTYSQIELDNISYNRELSIVKATGAKNAHVTTVAGSNAFEHRLRFQLGDMRTKEFCIASFGVSPPLENQKETNRRALDLRIESDEMLAFLNKLDNTNKLAAQKYATDWFKKSLTAADADTLYTPIVKPSSNPEYRPIARTKIIVESPDSPRCTQIFQVVRESSDSVDEYIEVGPNAISRGSRVIVVVEASGIWIASKNLFGMSLVATHILVWPSQTKRGIDTFMLPGKVPTRAMTTSHNNHTDMDEADMADVF